MSEANKVGFLGRIKKLFIGEARNPLDQSVFHNISLVAFFAWVGLGADGISSSCYGPQEAFLALGQHHYLGIIVALMTALTIFVIAESYSMIIELFPAGGGGYLVATKLLSPRLGMISGSALLIDYVLTITISIASGADALFSFLPPDWSIYKLSFAVIVVAAMILMNMRGVKESVTILVPVFLIFIISHAVVIIYALIAHFFGLPEVARATVLDVKTTAAEVGIFGLLFMLMRAYSMGAGTFTGIEAVSNGLPILREPKVKTAKKTMLYMMISLASIVFGLMIAYTLYRVEFVPGKTLNAVLFERVAAGWGLPGYVFVLITLFSEAAILFVAAQAGFIDGPRVLANMATGRWVPKRFALLSDRLVTMNGIVIMGVGALILMVVTNGSVGYLVVLYSINVFITFCLSQAGMVRHWWEVRKNVRHWFNKFALNGVGLFLTSFILFAVITLKFHEGAWLTLVITGTLIVFMSVIKMNYEHIDRQVTKMDSLVDEVEATQPVCQIPVRKDKTAEFNATDKTAVIFVKNFTATGLKTIFSIFKSFGSTFPNFVFIQVGLIDAEAFKGYEEMTRVKKKVEDELKRYVNLMRRHGYHAEGIGLYGIDTVEEVEKAAKALLNRYPNTTFFGGQIIFPRNSIMSKLLHNYTLFAIQHRLYKDGIPVFILPIEVSNTEECYRPM